MNKLQTTDHCDFCGRVLGYICNRDGQRHESAERRGLFCKKTNEWKYFCSDQCCKDYVDRESK
jgi:hypothetical protein